MLVFLTVQPECTVAMVSVRTALPTVGVALWLMEKLDVQSVTLTHSSMAICVNPSAQKTQLNNPCTVCRLSVAHCPTV